MITDSWDDWLGMLALEGVDPRVFDLNMMLAAYESALRRSAKDESAWRNTRAKLYAEPREVRDARIAEQRAAKAAGAQPVSRAAMTVDDAEAMLARFAASEATFG